MHRVVEHVAFDRVGCGTKGVMGNHHAVSAVVESLPCARFGLTVIPWTWTRLLRAHHASLEMFRSDTHRELWRCLCVAVVLRCDPVVLFLGVCRARLHFL